LEGTYTQFSIQDYPRLKLQITAPLGVVEVNQVAAAVAGLRQEATPLRIGAGGFLAGPTPAGGGRMPLQRRLGTDFITDMLGRVTRDDVQDNQFFHLKILLSLHQALT